MTCRSDGTARPAAGAAGPVGTDHRGGGGQVEVGREHRSGRAGRPARPAPAARSSSPRSARRVCWRGSAVRLPAGQQAEAVVQPGGDLLERQAHAARRPAPAPAGCRPAGGRSGPRPRRCRAVRAKPGCAGRGPLDEQPHRRRTAPALAGRHGASIAAARAAGPATATSPATPSGSRLVARTRSPGQARSSASTSCAQRVEQVLAVVEHEQAPPAAQVFGQAFQRASAGLPRNAEQRGRPPCRASAGSVQRRQLDQTGPRPTVRAGRPRAAGPAASCRPHPPRSG